MTRVTHQTHTTKKKTAVTRWKSRWSDVHRVQLARITITQFNTEGVLDYVCVVLEVVSTVIIPGSRCLYCFSWTTDVTHWHYNPYLYFFSFWRPLSVCKICHPLNLFQLVLSELISLQVTGSNVFMFILSSRKGAIHASDTQSQSSKLRVVRMFTKERVGQIWSHYVAKISNGNKE